MSARRNTVVSLRFARKPTSFYISLRKALEAQPHSTKSRTPTYQTARRRAGPPPTSPNIVRDIDYKPRWHHRNTRNRRGIYVRVSIDNIVLLEVDLHDALHRRPADRARPAAVVVHNRAGVAQEVAARHERAFPRRPEADRALVRSRLPRRLPRRCRLSSGHHAEQRRAAALELDNT